MTAVLRSLSTRHLGLIFRSRLEARWAEYFKRLGVTWCYEPEGFVLPNGQGYCPDFFLPQLNCFAEVKPQGDDFHKARLLATTGKTVLLLEGLPHRMMRVLRPGDANAPSEDICCFWIHGRQWKQGEVGRLFFAFGSDPDHGGDAWWIEEAIDAAIKFQFSVGKSRS